MARVYNPTMLMLDPNNVMNAMRVSREREESERDAMRGILQGVKGIGESAGGVFGRALRQSEIGGIAEDADEEWKAAVERFVDTGDPSAMSAYKTRKAEQEYRDKMAEIERINAENARKAASNTEKELSIKEANERAARLNDIKLELNDAIVKARDAEKKGMYETAANAYAHAKKAMQIEGVPEEAIPPLPGYKGDGEGTGDADSYLAQKNIFKDKFKQGFATDADLAEYQKGLEEFAKGRTGAEDEELVKMLDEGRKAKSKETRDREAFAARVKNALTFSRLSAGETYQLQKKDKKKYEEMKAAFEELSKRADWDELAKKYGGK